MSQNQMNGNNIKEKIAEFQKLRKEKRENDNKLNHFQTQMTEFLLQDPIPGEVYDVPTDICFLLICNAKTSQYH